MLGAAEPNPHNIKTITLPLPLAHLNEYRSVSGTKKCNCLSAASYLPAGAPDPPLSRATQWFCAAKRGCGDFLITFSPAPAGVKKVTRPWELRSPGSPHIESRIFPAPVIVNFQRHPMRCIPIDRMSRKRRVSIRPCLSKPHACIWHCATHGTYRIAPRIRQWPCGRLGHSSADWV